MTSGGLHYDRYHHQGRDEWLMRIGDPRARPVLFVPPLFEEMNRCRALIAGAMRVLAAGGWCGWLPDLPGTGESERALEEASWGGWRGAVTAASGQVAELSGHLPVVASLRGGALLDDAADALCHWRLAPATGASVARDLARIGLAGGAENGGYPVPPLLRFDLEAAVPAAVRPLRLVRLATDPGGADRKVEGAALWRRSEPSGSDELSRLIACDIMEGADGCAGS
ncbi:MAG: hypothetical protein ACK4K7_11520 [Allosphingosinicella sp.]|uniref:hypothetical protein n=1 Tax=Allosphingosinicella sp. TaxID=2823234 RepID=UPI00392B20B7